MGKKKRSGSVIMRFLITVILLTITVSVGEEVMQLAPVEAGGKDIGEESVASKPSQMATKMKKAKIMKAKADKMAASAAKAASKVAGKMNAEAKKDQKKAKA